MMKTPIPLKLGLPGETIPVLMPNGKIIQCRAGNVINSSQIQVHGEYVFCATSPRVQLTQRDEFRKRDRVQEGISCQLVGASIFMRSLQYRESVTDGNGVLLREIPAYSLGEGEFVTHLAEDKPYFSWRYDLATHACQAISDGSGQYASFAECLDANPEYKSSNVGRRASNPPSSFSGIGDGAIGSPFHPLYAELSSGRYSVDPNRLGSNRIAISLDGGFQWIFDQEANSWILWHQCEKKYIEHLILYSLFLKVHDPDLPIIPFYEFFPLERQYLYFAFLGDRAYFVAKIGKLREPGVPIEERKAYQIKVIKFKIGNNAITKEETNYFYPTPVIINDPDLALKDVMTSYTDKPATGNSCIDDEVYYFYPDREDESGDYRFMEVNYQKLSGKTLVYKVPGFILGAD
jgi:hypothetical protein